MCNCKTDIEDKLKLQKGTDKVFMWRYGRSEIAITPITNAGEYSKHHRYDSAKWLFCPFCGKPR